MVLVCRKAAQGAVITQPECVTGMSFEKLAGQLVEIQVTGEPRSLANTASYDGALHTFWYFHD